MLLHYLCSTMLVLCLQVEVVRLRSVEHFDWTASNYDELETARTRSRFEKRLSLLARCQMRGEAEFASWSLRANNSLGQLSLLHPSPADLEPRGARSSLLLNEADESDWRCPAEPRSSNDPLSLRALCPWYWRLNRDDNRIPSVLPEAKCRCEVERGDRKLYYSCQPVTITIRVLRVDRLCHTIEWDTEEVAVACAMVHIRRPFELDKNEFSAIHKTKSNRTTPRREQ